MDLKISNCNNFFKIKGVLNKKNLGVFQTEFQNIFDKVQTLTISIEDVETIDSAGVKALAELHREAIAKNKNLSIIGSGCKDLYNHFKTEIAA
ncbi:ABC-type transporter Mla MlaB component [Mariniflexile fucanivorans]|uniref:ABC-type transporter Mla MlaB component n=1 Tax=Mariniflexile fucanivorans TaxID=264023 RepID=A0A4R1RQH7_9FLAO|nr:STAS domain-containing protein [Mariniflexile fucanivorans]TCL68645.1 ABC-type transporter Mla MlaB component [Mariniflexile fucanivorans]